MSVKACFVRAAVLASGLALAVPVAPASAQAQPAPAAPAAPATTAPAQPRTLKIAVIDTQEIILSSSTGKAVLADLDKLSKAKQEELKGKQDEINQLRTKISDGQLTLSEDKLGEMQKELQEKTIAMQRATDDAQRELDQKKQAALSKIERQVMPVIDQVGKEGGYTLIFRKFESGLIFADDAIDITKQVIARLDSKS